ncbi:hypothetical protein JCM33374_g3832 [Metschnikowia sp. JCM 33374]|nr:hypothetical protein JCM33374_g3832 [Metschnikowia sp. JCM 33374]
MPANTALAASLGNIRHQSKLMKENLADGRLLHALKNCVNFLTELRSSAFSPKEYYELYMAVFDALDAFCSYLISSNTSKQAKKKDAPFLTDLYELVQYSGNIVPRLYLMIAIGTTCMAVKNAATKDIMKDMMEMCRGVQHPIRGLFLRHYLCQRTKDVFPMQTTADFNDTVDFLVANFVEMNKLWVRLQHQGHSSERADRYQERKELKILVGSNLVRLSQVVDDFSADGYSAANFYSDKLFPLITEQIIQCKDPLAQTYLIDVVIQIFPDTFHFATLDSLLNGVFVKLHPSLSKAGLVAALVDRFVTYHTSESALAAETSALVLTDGGKSEAPSSDPEASAPSSSQSSDPATVSVDAVFSSFWAFYTNLRLSDPPLPSDELVSILQSLVKLVLVFDAKNVSNLDKIYQFAAEDLQPSPATEGSSDDKMQTLWKHLLTTPVQHFASITSLLSLPFFYELYSKITIPHLQKSLSCDIAEKLLESAHDGPQILSTAGEIDNVFKYLQVLIEHSDSQLNTSKDLGVEKTIKLDGGQKLVTQTFLQDQETVCKVLHLIGHPDDFKCLSNLFYVKKKYLSKSPANIVYTYPTLITRMTNILRITGYRLLNRKKKNDADQSDLMISSNFKNISVIIDEIYLHHQQFNAELVLKLYLNLATVADQLRQQSIAYELFSQCFVVYEENLVLASSQGQTINPHDSMGGSLSYQSVIMIANRLASSRYFSKESYENLITKITLYGSKLLKKQDQCRSIYQCAHLWWWCDLLIDGKSPTVEDKLNEDEIKTSGDGQEPESDNTQSSDAKVDQNAVVGQMLYQDPKRVLECLQKALRVADSCMDPYLSLKLFVEILNRCLIFNIYDNWMVDSRYISGLIDLIRTNFANFEDNHLSGVDDDQEAKLLRRIEALFERTLDYLRDQQRSGDRFRDIVV